MSLSDYPNIENDIRDILANSDAALVSAKMVRKALAEKYPELDIKSNKDELDAITVRLFHNEESSSDEEDSKPLMSRAPSSSSGSGATPLFAAAYKIPKVKSERVTHLETTAEYTQRLQREYQDRLPATRSDNQIAPKKKSTSFNLKKKVKVDEDPNAPKKKKSTSGFNKPHLLSNEMAFICGAPTASRPEVTSRLWKYIKANGLQNPRNGNEIICDGPLKVVLGHSRITSFAMAKEISRHLQPFAAPLDYRSPFE